MILSFQCNIQVPIGKKISNAAYLWRTDKQVEGQIRALGLPLTGIKIRENIKSSDGDLMQWKVDLPISFDQFNDI